MAIAFSVCFAAIATWIALSQAGTSAKSLSGFSESFSGSNSTVAPTSLPPQAVFIDPQSIAVLGTNGSFRESAISTLNPTNASPPFFQAFHPNFVTNVLGDSASIRVVASNSGFAFAHEAPIWNPETDEVFFVSNDGGALGFSDINHNNQVAKISLGEVAQAADASGSTITPLNVTVTALSLPETVQMTNGGTGPFHGQLLFVDSGRGPRPPNIVLIDPASPNNTTFLLDNFYGRQFNSLNDIKIHKQTGLIYFTDSVYGFLNQFRPGPLIQPFVYLFDPVTRRVKVAADGFDKPNGVALSEDGKTAFVTDTGIINGVFGVNQTEPATVYKFDIDQQTGVFTNRRIFAFADSGVPDGIQIDTQGNVYSGCGDGVQVWDSTGTLLGKFFLNTTSSNMVFAGKGRLVIMAETAIYLAEIKASGFDLFFP
ncbi:hypothetical protein PHLGIDRAFT_130720 [Phlebiopsis gigantea 11061_1 CR5-6]|uniref:SMP-30/Gluconolactonase/LRE-like region domain-containing protein n=1 Tax=Phlebiopsis gigantea (strain 11061_1 CR5-6) TaxID=745531 RepID=A0A0C3ND73_PHLG1|nr:hypothetical protein PHLGIDRAFT_130720 [Phlebiopsis gigantea 11061_1 CR5-6]